MSFSQYGEDQYIIEVVKGCKTKRLLDIGAWDAKIFSNSRLLIESGWEAVLIEPSPGPLRNLVLEYGYNPKVKVVSGAVTVHGAPIELEITDDALSGDDPPSLLKWKDSGVKFIGKMTSPAMSVKEVFTYFGGNFEFVNFDTEGTSIDLFAEMCRVGPHPRCVCVEHDSRFVELSQHAEANNYQLVHENGTNRIYKWTGTREW